MNKDAVLCTIEKMVIPTYPFGYDNPLPVFPETEPVQEPRWIYPYPQHTYHTRIHYKNTEYTAIKLENRFIRLGILPSLGGRIWSCYDKVAQREVFHRNETIIPAMMGVGRAYVAGGMEINIPDAHSITNCWPRDYRISKNPDRSISVVFYEWERVYRMTWGFCYTLHPGASRIEISYHIYNRSCFPGRFRFWCNPSVAVTDKTELCFPEERADEHGGFTYFSWPQFMGLDLSKFKNIPEVLGLYFLDTRDGWFGAYDESLGGGVAHYANPYMVRGKKLWSWGNSYRSRNRMYSLSDPACRYIEIQSGRIISQDYYEKILPQEYFKWEEFWYPVAKIGGISKADDKFVVVLRPIKENIWKAGIQANQVLKNICMTVREKNGRVLLNKKFTLLSPENPFVSTINVQGEKRLELIVMQDGKNCFLYETPGKKEKIDLTKKEKKTDETSAEACFLRGEFHENNGELRDAEEWYKRSLRLDNSHSRTLVAIGRILLKGGNFTGAEELFSLAIQRDEYYAEAYYYSALGYFFAGNLEKGRSRIDQHIAFHPTPEACLLSGQIESKTGNFILAIDRWQWALKLNAEASKPKALLAAVYRRLRENTLANAIVEELNKKYPAEMLGWFECLFALPGKKREGFLQETIKNLFYDPHRLLESAIEYINIGFYDNAVEIINLYINHPKLFKQNTPQQKIEIPPKFQGANAIYPLAYYLLGYAFEMAGNTEKANSAYKKGSKANPGYAFPNRIEEYLALSAAIRRNPRDASGYYYLGNYLFYYRRFDEGMENWKKSISLGLKHAVAYRNLGLAEWRLKKNQKKSLTFYRKAFSLLPWEHNLLTEFYRLIQDYPEFKPEFAKLVARIEPSYENIYRIYLISGMVLELYASQGWWGKFDRFIKKCIFPRVPNVYYNLWKDAMLLKMKHFIAQRELKEALDVCLIAENPPENLGSKAAPPNAKVLIHSDIWFFEGLIHELMGNKDNARILWEKAANENFCSYWFEEDKFLIWKARVYQAAALEKLGEYAKANAIWEGINQYFKSLGISPPIVPEKEIENLEQELPTDISFKTPEN